jgi:hypothetical protein
VTPLVLAASGVPLWAKVVCAITLVLWGVWVVWGGRRADRRRATRFVGRAEIPLAEFVAACRAPAPLDESLVRQLLHELAGVVGATPGQLRPTDRFDGELAPEKGWEIDDGIYLVYDTWAKKAQRARTWDAKQPLLTLGDLVVRACRTREAPR